MTPPILQQVDETKSFCLKTDASNYALGAVLLQGEKDNEHPIEYASRLLLAAEKNYSTTEREALAVVWAVKKFRGYIEGSEISVLTDHQPLKWLFSLKSPTGRLARWALELQPYNIQFGYMPGRQNIVADTLSRPPCPIENHIDVCECFAVYIDFPRQGAGEIRKAQLEDDELEKIIKSFEEESHNITEYIDRGYMMMDGVLYRYCSEQETENGQLVVPKSMRSAILWKFHDDPTAGHYGVERTISRMLPHYYWKGIRSDITKYVKKCDECQRYKPTNLKPAGLYRTVSSNQRFEIIAMDLVGPLPRTKNGHQWILVVEDLCSRWVELFALKEATAENCAIIVLNEIILRFGVPRRIHTDNGSQFISAVMQKLTFCLGIEQSFTPVYHPEANPVERKNRDLKTQLAIYVGKDHTSWNCKLPMIRFAMNTSKCGSTNYSAAYLTFGRELRSPLEANHDLRSIITSENFIPQITPHLLRLAETLQLADEAVIKMQNRNKNFTDSKRRSVDFQVGDKVLVATHVLSNANKMISSKLVPRRDGYTIIAKKGTCFVIASETNLKVPLGTYHASQLTIYNGSLDTPIYPLKSLGRPKVNSPAQLHAATKTVPTTEADATTNSTNSILKRTKAVETTNIAQKTTKAVETTNTAEAVAAQHNTHNNNFNNVHERRLRPRQPKK